MNKGLCKKSKWRAVRALDCGAFLCEEVTFLCEEVTNDLLGSRFVLRKDSMLLDGTQKYCLCDYAVADPI